MEDDHKVTNMKVYPSGGGSSEIWFFLKIKFPVFHIIFFLFHIFETFQPVKMLMLFNILAAALLPYIGSVFKGINSLKPSHDLCEAYLSHIGSVVIEILSL